MEESSSRNQLVKTDSIVTQQSEIDLQQMSEAVFGTNSPIKASTMKNELGGNGTEKKSMRKWYTLTGFLHEIYIPMLKQPVAKVFIFLFKNRKFLGDNFATLFGNVHFRLHWSLLLKNWT